MVYGIWQYINPQIVIQWSTASEVDSAGFFIFRGENPDGPFEVQINRELIPASGQVVSGSDYQITDKDVIPEKTYYYQLQEVQLNGEVETFGPIETSTKRQGLIEIGIAIFLGLSIFFVQRKQSNPSGKEVDFAFCDSNWIYRYSNCDENPHFARRLELRYQRFLENETEPEGHIRLIYHRKT